MKINKIYIKFIIFIFIGLGIGKIYSIYFINKNNSKKKENLVIKRQKLSFNKKVLKKTKLKKNIRIKIGGAIKSPGIYDLPYGKRFLDLIKLAGGYKKGAFRVKKNYFLKNGQEFTIKYKKKIKLEIIGEINKPGSYNMYLGDKVYDLIKKAGGITPNGLIPHKNYFLKDNMRFIIYKRKK